MQESSFGNRQGNSDLRKFSHKASLNDAVLRGRYYSWKMSDFVGIACSCLTSYCEHEQYWSVATAWGMLLASSWSPFRSFDSYIFFSVLFWTVRLYVHTCSIRPRSLRLGTSRKVVQDPDDDKDCHYAVMYDFQILACVIWMSRKPSRDRLSSIRIAHRILCFGGEASQTFRSKNMLTPRSGTLNSRFRLSIK